VAKSSTRCIPRHDRSVPGIKRTHHHSCQFQGLGKLYVVAAYAPSDTALQPRMMLSILNWTRLLRSSILDHTNKTYLLNLRTTGLVILLGDFNAVPGDDRSLAPDLIGPFHSGMPNNNTNHFLNFCTSNRLSICGI